MLYGLIEVARFWNTEACIVWGTAGYDHDEHFVKLKFL